MKEFIKQVVKEVIYFTIRDTLLEAINTNNSNRIVESNNNSLNSTPTGKLLNITPDTELTWREFQKVKEVVNLPLHEQKIAYNTYLETLSRLRSQTWITGQPKGPVMQEAAQQYLAQESFDVGTQEYFLILQENGSKIIIT